MRKQSWPQTSPESPKDTRPDMDDDATNGDNSEKQDEGAEERKALVLTPTVI